MKTTLIVAGALAIATVAVAVPAHAKSLHAPVPGVAPAIADVQQIHHKRRHILPRHVIVRSLYRRGYRKVHNVQFRNGYWRARALGRRGIVALKIHPRTAKIVHRRLIRPRHRPYYPNHRDGFKGGLSFSFTL